MCDSPEELQQPPDIEGRPTGTLVQRLEAGKAAPGSRWNRPRLVARRPRPRLPYVKRLPARGRRAQSHCQILKELYIQEHRSFPQNVPIGRAAPCLGVQRICPRCARTYIPKLG